MLARSSEHYNNLPCCYEPEIKPGSSNVGALKQFLTAVSRHDFKYFFKTKMKELSSLHGSEYTFYKYDFQ